MMSPERVCTSRSTAPLTWNVLSKCPCGVEAAAKPEANSSTNAVAPNGDRAGIVETAIRQIRCLLMLVTPRGVFLLEGLGSRTSGLGLTPKTLRPTSLLKHDLITFLEAAQHFRLGAVRNPDIDRELILAIFSLWVRNLHRRLLVLIVKNRAFRNLQDILVFFKDDFGVGGHLGLKFAARILDRHPHFKRGDVVLLHAHRRNLCHLAGESLVLEGFHLDPRGLAEINLADIALVHFALHIDFAGIA